MPRKFLISTVLLTLSVAGCARPTPQAQQQPANQTQANTNAPPATPTTTHLKVGDPAPAFTLTNTQGEKVSLSDFRGKKNVVLAFYVLAFTGG
jgi:peroxiredoxin Q/BCP